MLSGIIDTIKIVLSIWEKCQGIKHDNNFKNEKMEHDPSVKLTAKLIVANIRLLEIFLTSYPDVFYNFE